MMCFVTFGAGRLARPVWGRGPWGATRSLVLVAGWLLVALWLAGGLDSVLRVVGLVPLLVVAQLDSGLVPAVVWGQILVVLLLRAVCWQWPAARRESV